VCDRDQGSYLTTSCGYDEYDCCSLDHSKIEDGVCSGDDRYLSDECGFEGYDCCPFPQYIEDGHCGIENFAFVSASIPKQCGYDGQDCFVDGHPNCQVSAPNKVGNGVCNGGKYNSEECGWDGGDCIEFNKKYPDCYIDSDDIDTMGDGLCHKYVVDDEGMIKNLVNRMECGFDAGDCVEFNAKYISCPVPEPFRVGNGHCDGGPYNTTECGFDGGDCIGIMTDFNLDYPDCKVAKPEKLGDGVCNSKV
jgi:hypothetical protein